MLVLIAMSYPFTELVIENGADRNHGLVLVPSHPSRAAVKWKPTGPVRVVQGFLYVVSSLQLFTAFTGPCVMFSMALKSRPWDLDDNTLYVMISNAFLGIVGGLGVVVLKGRSRVRMIILLGASVLVSVISCITIDVIRFSCTVGYTSRCYSKFGALLAIESVVLTFTILGIVGTSILLCMSCARRNNVTL